MNMGWDYSEQYNTKEKLVQGILDQRQEYLRDTSLQGDELWTVENYNGKNIIVVYLLDSIVSRGKTCWGCKSLTESEGPFYYKCPKEFLALAPVANKTWRDTLLLV